MARWAGDVACTHEPSKHLACQIEKAAGDAGTATGNPPRLVPAEQSA